MSIRRGRQGTVPEERFGADLSEETTAGIPPNVPVANRVSEDDLRPMPYKTKDRVRRSLLRELTAPSR